MKEIATPPSPNDWIGYGFLFLTLSVIGPIVPLIGIAYYNIDTPTGHAPLWSVAAALIFGAAVAFWLIRGMINRHYWRLTANELCGGQAGGICLPLSSVEKIIVGLPGKLPITGMDKLISPLVLQSFIIQKRLSLLVVFRDQSLLPLNLHSTPDGTALMTELVTRLEDRVEHNHEYGPEEIRRLRRADSNVLIRKR